MIVVHDVNKYLLQRNPTESLTERLNVMSTVVVSGARQTGKSMLVKELIGGDRRYYSLDDFEVRDAADHDPGLLVGGEPTDHPG